MKAILVDVTKCTGCEQCVAACQKAHHLEPEIPVRKLSRDGLSSRRLTTVVALPAGGFAKKQCLHCLEPGCVDACLVGAIQKTSAGPVIYDRSKCIGCRYCMLACPVSIPRYEWEATIPYMQKCDFCQDRVTQGQSPICVGTCKNGALTFGDRDELLALAHATVRREPDKYLDHVYGEKELGGSSVLYITKEPLDVLGWPSQVGQRSLASFTWPVMSKTPVVAAGVATFLIGTHFIIKRRMEIEAAQHREQSPETESKEDDSAENTEDEGGAES
jgi:formate dehydrogenase iron-sulfur subunit